MKKHIYETQNAGDSSKYDMEFKVLNSNATQIDMKYSKTDRKWTTPGEKIGSLFDNGNYVSVNVQGKKLYLDYAQVEYLRLILHAYDQANAMKRPSVYPTHLNKFEEVK